MVPATSPSLTARLIVLLSARPRNPTLMPWRGATSRAMYSMSACSAALPSLVATMSVAPAISFGDSVFPKSRNRPATINATTTTRLAAIQIHFGRFLSSNP